MFYKHARIMNMNSSWYAEVIERVCHKNAQRCMRREEKRRAGQRREIDAKSHLLKIIKI